MIEWTTHLISGELVRAESGAAIPVRCSATEEVFASSPSGTVAEANRAVEAAAAAFDAWSRLTPEVRAGYVAAIASRMSAGADAIAENITREVGMPLKLAQRIQLGLPLRTFGTAQALAAMLVEDEFIGPSKIVREPVGVVACITPWNYPLHQIAAKVVPALVAGNTVVLKPSEIAPTSAMALVSAALEAGLPPGVFNVVFGDGPTVGEVLASHPLVDMVSFTGSTRAGRRVAALAAETVKRVALELGGKSACVVLDDADLAAAVRAAVGSCTLNSGQTCSALTRLVVPRERLAEAEKLAAEGLSSLPVGDPFDPSTRVGPLSSSMQRDRVRAHLAAGVAEGARIVVGGPETPQGLERGYYVAPTLFADVSSRMTIAQQEIFGPVLCLLGHEGDDDAVRIANDSIYGLSGAVFSADDARAERVARRMRTGQVAIGEAAYNPDAPFGGFKQSGIGREYGRLGLHEFTEPKALTRKA